MDNISVFVDGWLNPVVVPSNGVSKVTVMPIPNSLIIYTRDGVVDAIVGGPNYTIIRHNDDAGNSYYNFYSIDTFKTDNQKNVVRECGPGRIIFNDGEELYVPGDSFNLVKTNTNNIDGDYAVDKHSFPFTWVSKGGLRSKSLPGRIMNLRYNALSSELVTIPDTTLKELPPHKPMVTVSRTQLPTYATPDDSTIPDLKRFEVFFTKIKDMLHLIPLITQYVENPYSRRRPGTIYED